MSVSPPSPRADSWTTPSIAKVKKDEDWTLKGGWNDKKKEKKKEKQAETYRLLPRQDEREATSLLCQSGAHRIHFVRVIILLLEPINRSSVCGHFRQRWVEANRISTEIDLSWMGNQKKKKKDSPYRIWCRWCHNNGVCFSTSWALCRCGILVLLVFFLDWLTRS